MKLLITKLLLFFCISSWAQDVSKEMEITIHPYKKVTNGAFFQVITLSSPDCYVEYLDGFDFEWGFTYRLRVKETHLQSPPEDGSSYEYELLEVISKTRMEKGYTFKMGLFSDLYLSDGTDQVNNFQFVNDSTYRYMNEVNIQYPKGKANFMNEILSRSVYKKGTFVFIDANTIRLK